MEEMVSQSLNDPPPSGCFMVGRWHVAPAASELRDGDLTVRLRPKTMDLLVVLAEKPGEVLGTRQTGLMEFRVAQLPAHAHLLDQVQAVASSIIDEHPELLEPLIQRWTGSSSEFAKV